MPNTPKLGNVVKDYYQGNVHILICDDYCHDKTPEEVKAILYRIADKAYPVLLTEHKSEDNPSGAAGGI